MDDSIGQSAVIASGRLPPTSRPPAILRALVKHPLTDAGIATFLADWKKTGQKII